jgi:hypothetical protein
MLIFENNMAPRGGIELPRGKAPQAFQACALAARLPRHSVSLESSKNSYHTKTFSKSDFEKVSHGTKEFVCFNCT